MGHGQQAAQAIMTKQDYKLIASVVKQSSIGVPGRETIAVELADAIEGWHPRFNREKFYLACGLSSEGWQLEGIDTTYPPTGYA